MDKLSPILKHWFWILFGFVVILVLAGWYMGATSQAKNIDERTDAINGLSVTNGAQTPNELWRKGLTKIREERQQRLDVASDMLWDQQVQYMVWPARMQSYVEGKLFGDNFSINALNTYRSVYDSEVYRLQRIVDPITQDRRTGNVTGKMLMPISALPVQSASTMWQTGAPESKEVWYLQEDIWLMGGLLESVRDLNLTAGANATISRVPVKQIVSLVLKGGDRSVLEGSGEASGDMMGMEGMEGMGAMAPMAPGMMDGGAGMPGMEGGGGTGGAANVDFDLAEEIGPETPVAPEGGEEGGDMMGGMPGMEGMDAMGGMPGMGMGGMGGQGNPLLTMRRYVDDGPDLPYKTRAFKMTVVMDHRKIPEFLIELTNSPFPVTILRVNWAMQNPNQVYDQGGPTGSGRGGAPGMGMPGMEGGGSGGGGFQDNALGGSGNMGMGGFGGGGMPGMGGGFGFEGAGPGMGGMPGGQFGGMGAMPGGGFGAGAMPGGGGMPGMNPLGGGLLGGAGGMPGGGMMGGGMPGEESMVGPMVGQNRGPTGAAEIAPSLADPYLATVVVGGLMTIYRDPAEVVQAVAEADSAAADGAGEGTASEGAPAGGLPADGAGAESVPAEGVPADGMAPADGMSPAEGAAPMDGTIPAPSTPGVSPPGAEGMAPGAPLDSAEGANPEAGGAAPVPGDGTTPGPMGEMAPSGTEAAGTPAVDDAEVDPGAPPTTPMN